ncbi:hypothetical protein SPTER_20760 [Sporomusa termitida]|uniref:Uncharacterized protein n=1 Tax=Sporomusa termitida TaxID=2377 RepID=A0A517DTR0_9FIRM|nr:hypothetical protein SPTER_20760 [Sporomusa termitida]
MTKSMASGHALCINTVLSAHTSTVTTLKLQANGAEIVRKTWPRKEAYRTYAD